MFLYFETQIVAKLKNSALGCHRLYRDARIYIYNAFDHGETEGVAKLRKPTLGRHRSYRDAIIYIYNIFGHGKTMTAVDNNTQL